MSGEPNSADQPSPSNEPLQFDRAEFTQGSALSCSFCKAPITGPYFQINGQTACSNCRGQVETAFVGGSGARRALLALGAGIGAAIAGFLIYWGIRAATGYEFALVAILVGYMVGMAVRKGAQSRGGLFYQLMAVVLTYFSIASNYTPEVLRGMRDARAENGAAIEEPAAPTSPTTSNQPQTAPARNAPAQKTERGIPLWFEILFAFCFSLAVPFLSGPANILGWVIIAVGLAQAWRLNKRIPIQISGPFEAGSQASPLPT